MCGIIWQEMENGAESVVYRCYSGVHNAYIAYVHVDHVEYHWWVCGLALRLKCSIHQTISSWIFIWSLHEVAFHAQSLSYRRRGQPLTDVVLRWMWAPLKTREVECWWVLEDMRTQIIHDNTAIHEKTWQHMSRQVPPAYTSLRSREPSREPCDKTWQDFRVTFGHLSALNFVEFRPEIRSCHVASWHSVAPAARCCLLYKLRVAKGRSMALQRATQGAPQARVGNSSDSDEFSLALVRGISRLCFVYRYTLVLRMLVEDSMFTFFFRGCWYICLVLFSLFSCFFFRDFLAVYTCLYYMSMLVGHVFAYNLYVFVYIWICITYIYIYYINVIDIT